MNTIKKRQAVIDNTSQNKTKISSLWKQFSSFWAGNTYNSAFSLMELLTVAVLIIILAGLLAAGGTSAQKKAKIYQVKTMIASLESALAMYHVDFGAYPAQGSPISNNRNMVNLLADTLSYLASPDWQGPYINFKEDDLNGTIPNALLKDPWENSYEYSNSGLSCVIRSAGPDSIYGNGDDLTNQ